jgi:transposase
MAHHSEAFVALDMPKLRNAVAVADAGRNGEIRYLGEIDNTEAATRKLVTQLACKYSRLTFCYEAGPTGYGLYRLINSLGHDCIVAAPSLIPSKPGDRVKTKRRKRGQSSAVEHQSCSSEGGATAGELPLRTMWSVARSTPAFR